MTTRNQKQQKKYDEEQKKAETSPPRVDKKTIIGIVLIFCFFAILFSALSVDIRGYLIRHDPNWTTTTGQVQSIKRMTGITQSFTGNKTETVEYKIKYHYEVDDVEYEHEYIIGAGKQYLWRFVRVVKPLDSIEIYYEKKDPKNSYLNMNINSDFYRDKN